MEAFSLFEVNQYIRRVLALNFEEPFWVECEINSVSNSRGNVYLNLIEKAEDSEEVIASNSAQIWYRKFLFIKKKLGPLVDSILQSGIKVKLKVNVSYSERYGMSLVIEDIDPAYTFGQFEMTRQKTIESLRKKKLMDKNAALPLPEILQRIAVISSASAAGYQDFMEQLKENPYGYRFKVDLFQSAMQGTKTEKDVVAALRQAKKKKYDMIAIIRGGGSRLDLSAFDNQKIALGIANASIPVVTGIGHDIDVSVADMVSHTVLKTPTAVADWIIEHNTAFESKLIEIESDLHHIISERLEDEKVKLAEMEEDIKSIPALSLLEQEQWLDQVEEHLQILANQAISEAQLRLEAAQSLIAVLSPEAVLARGYVIVKQGETYLTKKKDVKPAPSTLELLFADGSLNVKQN